MRNLLLPGRVTKVRSVLNGVLGPRVESNSDGVKTLLVAIGVFSIREGDIYISLQYARPVMLSAQLDI